jgi:glycosyltransferase involved in cell wall biosynthesis
MADAARELLRDSVLWERMSARATADARERFSRDKIVPQYEEVYAHALAVRRGRAVVESAS